MVLGSLISMMGSVDLYHVKCKKIATKIYFIVLWVVESKSGIVDPEVISRSNEVYFKVEVFKSV